MADYGLTPQGPNIKRLDVILEEMHSGLSEKWGVNTRQNPESLLNHLLTNVADAIADLWEFGEAVYFSQYPDIGAPNWEIIVAAAAEQIAGAGLILWTCREGELLENALEACARWGLHFDAVNDSLPSWKKFYGDDTRKVGATEYWDDKAYRVQNGKLMKEAAHEMV